MVKLTLSLALALSLSGCGVTLAGVKATKAVCANREKIIAAAETAIAVVNQCPATGLPTQLISN